jgi:hypothetical protein
VNIVMAIEGVLRSHFNATPIPEGLMLYFTLNENNRVVLVANGPRAEADRWLKNRSIMNVDHIIDEEALVVFDEDLRERQITSLLADGKIDLFIDSDPESVAYAMEQGITSLLFGHPRWVLPEFRPEGRNNIKPWARIVAEVQKAKGIAPEAFDEDRDDGEEPV